MSILNNISWDKYTHVKTVVLLSRKIQDDRIEIDIDLDELDITTAESKATYEEIKEYVLNKYHFKVPNLHITQIKIKYGIKEAINYNISKKAQEFHNVLPIRRTQS